MKQWLSDQCVEIESLGKKEVAQFVKNSDGNITEALKLRLQIAKSSVKKYQAMQNAVCKDGRAHGMFQFYGANRSGRWAGRLIQLQNLPQNHMNDLAEARAIVKASDYDILQLLYDDKFIVNDFSAIEARVLAYLAGEKWRSQVFAEGKDIDCASASQMFGVPVDGCPRYGPSERRPTANIVQAISRDILCYAMKTLRNCFIVGHVHDELIIECDPRVDLKAVCEQMGRSPDWMPDILLRADGYETPWYRKD